MRRTVWLINLFGSPCAPSAFNPDNSLAALAGNLKAAGFAPRIWDYQTFSMFQSWFPEGFTRKTAPLYERLRSGQLHPSDYQLLQQCAQDVLTHQLQVVDQIARDLVAEAKSEAPLFIGFKLYSGEGLLLSRHLAAKLKEALDVPQVAGGPLIRVVGETYYQFYTDFDYLMTGECDRSIVSFANFCLKKSDISAVPGLIYRDQNEQIRANPMDVIPDLGALPDPCYDPEVYPSLYQKGEKSFVFQLDESRGCPNRCSFCMHPVANGNSFRTAPVRKIVDQIKDLQKRFGARAFRFTGSNTPKKFLREFSSQLLAEDLKILYSCFSSINTTDVSLIPQLKASGLAGIFIGVESLDQKVLKQGFNKHGQPVERVSQVLRAFIDAGIFTTTSWIYPAPFATEHTRTEMRDFISQLYGGRSADAGSVLLVPPAVIPGTAWFNNPAAYGFELGDRATHFRAYSELVVKAFLPAQLMNDLNYYSLNGKSAQELAAECDGLRRELHAAKVPLGLSDDWMLAGRLSGMPLKEFAETVTRGFVTGETEELRKALMGIDENLAADSSPMRQAA